MSDTVLWLLGDPPVQVDPSTPVVRADDLGLLRGESVFETLRVAGGQARFVDAHLSRLVRSAQRLALDLPSGWQQLVVDAVSSYGLDDGVLRLVCTKGGVGFALLTPVPAETLRGRVEGLTAATLTLGVPAGLRAQAPWLLGGVKSTSYAVNMASLRTVDADEVIWLSSDGEVLEAPTSTVCWVSGGHLVTPPADEVGVLAGTTMQVALSVCPVPYDVRRGTAEELRAAEEVLLLSSVRGVAPVVQLDGRRLGRGPVGQALSAAFETALLDG